jgi:hypothetical protein
MMETVFSVGSTLRLYNKDPMLAELELRESLEMAVEDAWDEIAGRELGCEKKTSCVLQLE